MLSHDASPKRKQRAIAITLGNAVAHGGASPQLSKFGLQSTQIVTSTRELHLNVTTQEEVAQHEVLMMLSARERDIDITTTARFPLSTGVSVP